MAESTKIQISEGTMIVELQQEVAFLRNRALVLSEMLLRADAEVMQLSMQPAIATAGEGDDLSPLADAEARE